ncbi:MAG: glycosyltransferase family 2 protein [Nanoarchaeota archaeon]
MRAKNKDVSFVILSHNDADMVIKAVSSIQKIKTKYKYDIFVADNGSKDGTPKKVKDKFKDINIIELPKNIGTAAYDAAIKKSNAKYVYFTGCDIEAKQDMLDKLVDFLEKNKDAAQAAPKYITINDKKKIDLAGTWLSRSFYSGIFKNNFLGYKNIEIPYIWTGLIRMDFIKKFGYLFDNDYFFYGEDVDLGMRIRLSGYKVFYIPDAIVYHAGSISRKIHKPYYLAFLMERNLLRTFLTALEPQNIIFLSPYVFFMRLFAMLNDILTLKFMHAGARLFAILWIFLNLNKIAKKRKKIQSARKVKDKKLFEHFSEKHLLKKFLPIR